MKIYTLGHSNYSIEKFLDILKTFNIECIVDIRGVPYSKYNVQYDKEMLGYTLNKEGFKYIYMGNEFGANRLLGKESYNEEGYADFSKVILEKSFKEGIKRLKNGCKKGYNIVLLGAMQEPIRCHRSILVGRELTNKGFCVKHILDDLTVVDQKEIEKKILDKYYPNRHQISIDSLLGNEKSEEELIEEAYKEANREIGRRVEKLD
ncbi:Protein of unknown function, DUF488 [Clostridium sp. DSM 8431]|uniref:DUF488 domain-containing protein n=1 Tax=Clostridium sp. DSM 8431 TaxID=1761781 RepID=UPI0008F3F66D|nr:DUF488 domain-containing protein [Clostridium sp. DSM 8431]SFU79572.1 Protein of unknown function, DUF488 [Clostridium sp. DSM 8431]